ncbi:MAG: glycosyltransferase [Bacteroidaceae bacterium]|nr:glycosyltransferase [Bacteroidaceae bacterium]
MLTQKEVAEVFLESDVVLSCSEYETFGATLAEGIASGCLAVTRGTGGQRDVVEHKKTGYVVEEAEPFANGILWAANQIDADFSLEKRKALHEEMQKRLSSEVIIQQYLSICKQ